MKKLHISPELALPLDFVTWTQAILAQKGKGKSYTASVQAEELLGAGQQIVVVDPTGAWFGLRTSADGKSPGFPIAILGGERGDVPLEVAAGELIADAIATEHFSAVIDLSLFRKGESLRFMAAFLETLYRRNREALHLFIDEADVVAPQKTFSPEQARALGATEDIVRRGRIRGIGCTLITQRPQVINKDVLSQVDMLTTLGMNHPKDLGAIGDWVAVHGDPAQAKRMIESLPALPLGKAWVWAPSKDIFELVPIRKRTTFDSGKTPKAGERAVVPKVLAPVDYKALGTAIAATAEHAKANDPKAMKARIAELEKQLAAKPTAAPAKEKRVEVAVIKPAELERVGHLTEKIDALGSKLEEYGSDLQALAMKLETAMLAASNPVPHAPAATPRPVNAASAPKPVVPAEGISGPQQRILNALAVLEHIGASPADKTQVALFAEASPTSSSYSNNLGSLRSAGLINYPAGGQIALTDAGRKVADAGAAPSTVEEMHMFVANLVGGSRWKILAALIAAYPGQLGKETLAERAGASASSSSYSNNLGSLRTLGLIDYPAKGAVRAEPVLFLEAR